MVGTYLCKSSVYWIDVEGIRIDEYVSYFMIIGDAKGSLDI